jgi:tetratricopeptide (TPR) repeat protein
MEYYLETAAWETACQTFQRWVDNQPDDSRAHYLLGYALQQSCRHEAAIQAYKASLILDESYAPALNNLGVLYTTREGHLDSAITLIQQALSLDPDSAPYYLDSLGWAYFKHGNVDRAIQTLREGIARCPTDNVEALGELFLHLGLVYESQHQRQLALHYAQRAYVLNPDSMTGQQAYAALMRFRAGAL